MKKIIGIGIIILGLVAINIKTPITNKNELRIFIVSDLHYFLEDYYKDCDWFEESLKYADGKMTTQGDSIISSFIDVCLKARPDFVFISGDLTFNGEVGSHQKLAEMLSTLTLNNINVSLIPGNHDVENMFAKGYGKDDYFDVEGITPTKFKEIYFKYGYEKASFNDPYSLSYRLDLNSSYSALMIDTSTHSLTGGIYGKAGKINENSLKWIENQLIYFKNHNIKPLVVMHHNLAKHNELLSAGYTINNQDEVGTLFENYGVKVVFSGHIHSQSITKYHNIYDIATASLSNAPHLYGDITLVDNELYYNAMALDTDELSSSYFIEVAKNRMAENLKETNYSDDQLKELLDVMSLSNYYYFSGVMNEHISEIKNMPGYTLLQERSEKDFTKVYLNSMIVDKGNQRTINIKMN